MKKLCIFLIGSLLTALGVVLFISPVPFGMIVLAIGVAMLIESSNRCASWISRRRALHRGLNKAISALQKLAPATLAAPLKRTDPGNLL